MNTNAKTSPKASSGRTLRYRIVPLALVLAVVALQGTVRQGVINVGLNRQGTAAIRVAIPEFRFAGAESARLAQVFNETLWNDLDFSGNIELASRSFYPVGVFASPGDIRVADWTAPGIAAQYVVYGSLALTGGRFSAAGRLRDLGAEQESIASVFPGADDQESTARTVAHNFADRILEQLGFGRGITRSQIAFVSDRTGNKEIYFMDYDGASQQRLTALAFIAIAPSWSPVDDRIAYTAWRAGGGNPRVEIVSTSGDRHNFQQMTGASNTIPSWSGDGKSIVYTSTRDGNSEIYWADASGANPRRLTTSPSIDTSPAINPATGRQIAFVSSRSGTPQIYTMDADGTNVQRITDEGGDAENPTFSPDGKMIAFAWQKPRTGVFDIYLYDLGTQKLTQLTNAEGRNERPTWAPDGKHIAFHSNRTGRNQIYAMSVDGKKVRQLTQSNGINEGPAWSGSGAR